MGGYISIETKTTTIPSASPDTPPGPSPCPPPAVPDTNATAPESATPPPCDHGYSTTPFDESDLLCHHIMSRIVQASSNKKHTWFDDKGLQHMNKQMADIDLLSEAQMEDVHDKIIGTGLELLAQTQVKTDQLVHFAFYAIVLEALYDIDMGMIDDQAVMHAIIQTFARTQSCDRNLCLFFYRRARCHCFVEPKRLTKTLVPTEHCWNPECNKEMPRASLLQCRKCRIAAYCCLECQTPDWYVCHRAVCRRYRDDNPLTTTSDLDDVKAKLY